MAGQRWVHVFGRVERAPARSEESSRRWTPDVDDERDTGMRQVFDRSATTTRCRGREARPGAGRTVLRDRRMNSDELGGDSDSAPARRPGAPVAHGISDDQRDDPGGRGKERPGDPTSDLSTVLGCARTCNVGAQWSTAATTTRWPTVTSITPPSGYSVGV